MSSDEASRPVLRIVRGNPDDTEIAALTAALAGVAAAQPDEEPAAPLSMWADRNSGLRHPAGRRPLRPGPNAWRASGMPG